MSIWVQLISVTPFGSVNWNANVWDEPLPLVGETETLLGPAFTVSVADVLWLREPLVPVTVMVAVPRVVEPVVVMVSVVDPEPVTDVGLKLGEAPEGKPDAANVMEPLNPLRAVVLTV